jgi:hypothetical protein
MRLQKLVGLLAISDGIPTFVYNNVLQQKPIRIVSKKFTLIEKKAIFVRLLKNKQWRYGSHINKLLLLFSASINRMLWFTCVVDR